MEFINRIKDLAYNTYHVDPGIFLFLYLLSIPFYYFGWFWLVREGLRIKKNDHAQPKIGRLIREKKILIPLGLNRVAWILPYLYIIIFGRNLPYWIWILMILWIGLWLYIFYTKLKSNLSSGNKEGLNEQE